MKRASRTCAVALVAGLILATSTALAQDGWKTLFDGKSLDGWMSAGGGQPGAGWVLEDGAMVRKQSAGDIWTKDRFGDFVLDLEFKTQGNSGIFIRTDNPKNNVQTGIEIQVDRPSKSPGKHSVGAFYDLHAPSKDPTEPDAWNKVCITAKGNMLSVEINGQKVNEMDLDKWTQANQNPDGTKNKFGTALKDFKREGHIGLQDHGAGVAYRNIRIKPL